MWYRWQMVERLLLKDETKMGVPLRELAGTLRTPSGALPGHHIHKLCVVYVETLGEKTKPWTIGDANG